MAYAFRNQTSAGNASGGALSINKPASTADGDLLVAVGYLETDTNTWSSVPSGWSLAASQANTGDFKLWMYWKIASGEPASWSWTPNVNAWRVLTCAGYSGGSGTGSFVDVVGTGNQGDAQIETAQTAPSLTTVTANDIVIFAYGNFGGANVTAMTGFTTNLRISLGGCTIADANAASAGTVTGTSRSNGGIGSQDFAAFHVAFRLVGAGGVATALKPLTVQQAVHRASRY